MIRKLQLKFIFIAMFVTAFVLYTIIGIVNARNYFNVINRADDTISLIVEGDGRFPTENETPPLENFSEDKEGPHNFSPETPFETRYFLVKFDSNGEVSSINLDKIAAIDEVTALTYALDVFKSDSQKGFKENNRYGYALLDGQDSYIFIDCTRDLYTFHSFLKASMLISLAGLIVVYILIILLSWIIVKPVALSYQKQKEFITDANHELKTPLTIIGANCDLLEIENGENKRVKGIKEQVERLTDLTNKLVFLSKMDEKNPNNVMTDFSLSEVANETSKSYVALADSLNKKYDIEIDRNITIKGDVALIRELLTILLDNAFKYSDENGDIKIKVFASNKNKIIKVSNATQGIPKGNLDKLFERFYRLEKSRNSGTGGHGIGLSIAKAIVELHKGKITAASQDGKMIVFTITLP